MTPGAAVAVAAAGAAAAVLVALPSRGQERLAALRQPGPGGPAARIPWWLAGALLGLLAGPVPSALGAAGGLLLRRVADRRAASRAAALERQRALEALAVLAGELRAGRAPADGLAAAAEVAIGPTAASLAAASAAARLAGDVPAALDVGGSAVPEALRGLAACWSVTAVSGSGLASGVERLVEGLRAAAAQRRAVEAELAGPRATAGLLAVLPAGGIGLAAALGAHPVHVLLHTPIGLGCLLAGVTLDLLGLAWTARLVSRAVGT